MGADQGQIEGWLVEEWSLRMASAIESMAGERPAATSALSSDSTSPSALGQVWRQPLPPLGGAVWIAPGPGAADALGTYILRAIGVEDSAPTEQKSTFQETLNQSLAGLAQALTLRLKREVNLTEGGEVRAGEPPPCKWTAVAFKLGDKAATFHIGIEAALVESIRSAEIQPVAPDPQPSEPTAARSPIDNSKTFALLLEVELPVAVSFGRAQIPLKDVLKLTTGSIVELNRAVAEPVEIIVNNCVIARGEVVVVEGNFGVRIQEVINRQDRLRTVQ